MLLWCLLALLSSIQVKAEYWLKAPNAHTVLSGDVEVQYSTPSPRSDLQIQLIQVSKNGEKLFFKRDVPARIIRGQILFPCNIFDRSGKYIFRLITTNNETTLAETEFLDVRWPDVTVHVPLIVETYSSNVIVQLYVETVQCRPLNPYSTYLELIYEGSSTWIEPSVLTRKELANWTWDASYDIIVECEYFDRAGNYSVKLGTNLPDNGDISISDTIIVMWSHRYSVSVAKNSVQPCDGTISVIYHYPRCILDKDRIRVYGKKTIGPLKYIRESRIENGKHSTKLSCDIFQDDFQEYCFSFVSTARNGAVFDLKTHCLPSLTDTRKLLANWNEWGLWSECSTSCGRGVQTRYRMCIPSINRTNCIGKAVQSRLCASAICEDQIQTTTEQPEEWDCPCGCEKAIMSEQTVRILIENCNIGVIWFMRAWPSSSLMIEIVKFDSPSQDYWITVRDGKSALGPVLGIIGPHTESHSVISLSDEIRLEVYGNNMTAIKNVQIVFKVSRSAVPRGSLAMVRETSNSSAIRLSAVHLTIIMLATVLCVITILMLLFQLCKSRSTKNTNSNLLASPELLTSISELSIKSPSLSPEDYLHNSFIFRSLSSLHPKVKWDKLPKKSDVSSPVRRRGKPAAKMIPGQRESSTPLTASVSELSTAASDDGFEYDYYDYGCHQEPGSFFCPDPVLMGWPPFIPLPPQGTEEFGDYPLQHFTPSPDPC